MQTRLCNAYGTNQFYNKLNKYVNDIEDHKAYRIIGSDSPEHWDEIRTKTVSA